MTAQFHFARLSPSGMERALVRALRHSEQLTIGLVDIVRLLRQIGQDVQLTEVYALLEGKWSARLGRCAANRWTLLPWERLQVPWTAPTRSVMNVQAYVEAATRFWVKQGYMPYPAEEPNERVRSVVARTLSKQGVTWLTRDPDGPFELTVCGMRDRYRVDPGRLPQGKLGTIWMHGDRWDITAIRGSLTAANQNGRQANFTSKADEVIVRLIAVFKDPVYRASRTSLGTHLYRILRAREVRLRVNEN